LKGWLKIKHAAEYADISERTLRYWLKQGLRHARKDGTVYIRPQWIDNFLLQYEVDNDVENTVDAILAEF